MSSFEETFKNDFETHFSCHTDILIEKPLMVNMFVQRKYGSSDWQPVHFLGFLPENEQYLMFASKITDPNVIALKTGNWASVQLSLPFTSNWTFSGKLYNVSHPKTFTRFFPPNIFEDSSRQFWNKKRLDIWKQTSSEFRALLNQVEFLDTSQDILKPFYEQLENGDLSLPEDEHASYLQQFCFLVLKITDVCCCSQDTMTKTNYNLIRESWEVSITDL